jgi:methylenetetrahydrofolate dehydrogenase (NADP+)/methenyltetrahydrofolate cyclohydrolase
MSANLIDGKRIAAEVKAEVAAAVKARVSAGLARPGLATILVGSDPASAVYVANKVRSCVEVGFIGLHRELPGSVSADEIAAVVAELNEDSAVNGILLQLPLPDGLDGSLLSSLIDPAKDVDGLTPSSVAALAMGRPGLRPCTPSGVVELLDRHDVAIEGSEAVILGRSDLVGRPLGALLLERNATVTTCHSRTRDLASVCARADILVAAVGRPAMVKADWVKQGATVIDVGINRTDSGLVGDVDFCEVLDVAGLITPVPGGVGPMTIAMLLKNTLLAAAAQEASA